MVEVERVRDLAKSAKLSVKGLLHSSRTLNKEIGEKISSINKKSKTRKTGLSTKKTTMKTLATIQHSTLWLSSLPFWSLLAFCTLSSKSYRNGKKETPWNRWRKEMQIDSNTTKLSSLWPKLGFILIKPLAGFKRLNISETIHKMRLFQWWMYFYLFCKINFFSW